jgi:hypothetical protein
MRIVGGLVGLMRIGRGSIAFCGKDLQVFGLDELVIRPQMTLMSTDGYSVFHFLTGFTGWGLFILCHICIDFLEGWNLMGRMGGGLCFLGMRGIMLCMWCGSGERGWGGCSAGVMSG